LGGCLVTNASREFDIVPVSLAVKAMRDNGYKNAAYAIAELMDNSIQAGAKTVQLLCADRESQVDQRSRKRLHEVAVLDDGCGMDAETLQIALQARCDAAGFRLDLQLPEAVTELTHTGALALYRGAMQAIDNVLMHANVDAVQLGLQCTGGVWRLHVEDKGTGCEPAAAAAAGGSLCALAAWLKGLGGGLRLESAAHQGCRIELWLPIQAI
jgi:signal transduction histidine kinase